MLKFWFILKVIGIIVGAFLARRADSISKRVIAILIIIGCIIALAIHIKTYNEDRKANLIHYEIGELEYKEGNYYRGINIKSANDKYSQYNFIIEIKADKNFLKNVNGPRPIGGGPIEYTPPYVHDNICEVTIVELKPRQAIFVGLTSDKKWNLLKIRAYKK